MGNTQFIAKQDALNKEFDCRLSAKQLRAMSKRCLDEEKKQSQLALAAMTADKPAIARIHAENSVRNKHMAERYLRMASHTEATAEAHAFIRQNTAVLSK